MNVSIKWLIIVGKGVGRCFRTRKEIFEMLSEIIDKRDVAVILIILIILIVILMVNNVDNWG